MEILYNILIFIASLILSGGVVYLISLFFSDLSSGTGAIAEAIVRTVIQLIILIVLTAIFNMLGNVFLL